MASKEKIREWELLFYDVWNDVDNDNVKRSTQNKLRELYKLHRDEVLENKVIKNELIRLFKRLCNIVNYPRTFDHDYIDAWIKDKLKKGSK